MQIKVKLGLFAVISLIGMAMLLGACTGSYADPNIGLLNGHGGQDKDIFPDIEDDDKTPSGGGGDIVGKWYATLSSANAGGTADFEFTSSGKLLVMGSDAGITYTTSGSKITVKMYGSTLGTTGYSISGKELTINTTVGLLVASTYYKP